MKAEDFLTVRSKSVILFDPWEKVILSDPVVSRDGSPRESPEELKRKKKKKVMQGVAQVPSQNN